MQKYHSLRLISFSSLLFSSLLLLGMLIKPAPIQASSIEGEPCSIWWVDKSVDGWPFVTVTWVDSCPRSCPQDVAGDFYNQSDTWCADLTPPPNIPGVYLGNACTADSSRTVALLTDGTFGTSFEIEGNGQVVAGTSHTFTGIPEGVFTARGQAHNSKGSSGWSSPVSAQHDYSAPVTTANLVGLTQNGWYVSPVSISFTANDVGCFGVNQTIYAVNGVQNNYVGVPFTIADDGIHTLQYRSTDGYHLEAEKSGIILIDSTAPSLQFILDRPQDVAGWWTAPLSITIFADDATSGLASLEYDLNGAGWVSQDSLMLTDGVHTLDAQATDNAGHLSYDGVILPIDSTAPLLTVQIIGEQGENSWFITPPTLTLSATDATSGVAGVLYQVENGSQTLYTAPLHFTREGLYTVQAFAVDNAQHITSHTFQIGYDITPPQTNVQLTETEDGMTITLNRWDGVSGFALTRMAINGVWGDYHAPVTVTDIGEYWIQFFTIDFAGNIEAEKIASFTIAETGVVVTQVPPLVNIVPPAIPPTTSPFETRDDFPPNLHDEGVYFTYPEDNRVADTAYPSSQIVFAGGNANNGSPVIPMENRISHIPRPIVDESALPNVNSAPRPNVVFANSPNIIQTLQILDVPDNQTTPATIQTTTTPISANNPVNGALATLATLGIITAGAGAITMTATALAKKREQDEAKSAQMATLQVQQSAQAQSAGANWATNQTMQASAKQAVVTQVMQSQANKDFWVAYAEWRKRAEMAHLKYLSSIRQKPKQSIFSKLLSVIQFGISFARMLSQTSESILESYLRNAIAEYGVTLLEDTTQPSENLPGYGWYNLETFPMEGLLEIYRGITRTGSTFAPIINQITGDELTPSQAFQRVFGNIYMGYEPSRQYGLTVAFPYPSNGVDPRNNNEPILILFEDDSFKDFVRLPNGFVVVHELGHAFNRRHDGESIESIGGDAFIVGANVVITNGGYYNPIYEDFIEAPLELFPNENLRYNSEEGFADTFSHYILNKDVLISDEGVSSARATYIESNLSTWTKNIICFNEGC